MKKILSYFSATVLVAFGLLTLFLSTSVIFDLFGVRAKEGNYVLFVVWANFISSVLYLVAAYGFVKTQRWTSKVLIISTSILSIAIIGLIFHINNGGNKKCLAKLLAVKRQHGKMRADAVGAKTDLCPFRFHIFQNGPQFRHRRPGVETVLPVEDILDAAEVRQIVSCEDDRP